MQKDFKAILSNIKFKTRLAMGRAKRKLFKPQFYSIENVKVEIDYQAIPPVIIDHMLCGLYETDELSVIKNILSPDDVVVDIGAGIGFVSSYIAKHLSNRGSIECFEANPNLISKIKRTHELNNVTAKVNNIILADSNDEVDFYISPHFWASSMYEAKHSKRVKVPTISFQDFINQQQPTMLVVDIEGGEIELFHDVDLSPVKKICIELHPAFTGLKKMNDMLFDLHKQGFNINEDYSLTAVKALIKEH